jgi:hypothetical protein
MQVNHHPQQNNKNLTHMALSEIKQISIKGYLQNMGVLPKKEFGYYGMYFSPFRDDHNASFKVDYRQNLWYDFGTGEGGSIIDLVMKLENCAFHEAVARLEKDLAGPSRNSFSFHRDSIPATPKNRNPAMTIRNICTISHPKLATWLSTRKIDLYLANLYCREVHYQVKDNVYFSIGFGNDSGGYELASPSNFKGCISPKDMTTVKNGHHNCLVFEGFWDFLSYLTLQKIEKTQYDVAVLNSVGNVQKSLAFLKKHRNIFAYLDNDESGRKAIQVIKSSCVSVDDRSAKYAAYKDVNDYLCGKKQAQQMKKGRGFRL